MAAYCRRCQRSFVHNRAFQDHLDDSSRHNFCFVCDADFPDSDGRDQHQRDQHNACSDCDRAFDTPSQLSAHLRSEKHAGRQYSCACNEDFSSPAGILLHIERGGCTEYSGHQLMHLISVGIRRDATGYCKPGANVTIPPKSMFMKDPIKAIRQQMQGHTKVAYHQRNQNYVCQYCLDEFEYTGGLGKHLAEADAKEGDIRYDCDDCDRQFDFPSGLCQHYESRCC
ncbi:hypothetical protein TWF481_006194 [Arthrobotrys musiformis]|uniref:C2H2-type domain-containing protein n=1 Tax=Arthrobotrys musiformis TaxID=47236 RepID=A0AAV9WH59_9PEZI